MVNISTHNEQETRSAHLRTGTKRSGLKNGFENLDSIHDSNHANNRRSCPPYESLIVHT